MTEAVVESVDLGVSDKEQSSIPKTTKYDSVVVPLRISKVAFSQRACLVQFRQLNSMGICTLIKWTY